MRETPYKIYRSVVKKKVIKGHEENDKLDLYRVIK